MNSHVEWEAIRAMALANQLMVQALMKSHPDPVGLQSTFLALANAYIDENNAQPDNQICLKCLKGHIEHMEWMLAGQTVPQHR